jgi:hypothetical protein
VAALAATAAARAVTSFIPSMWPWGINVQRFLDPALAVTTWAIVACTFVPAVGERVAASLTGWGDRLVDTRVARWLTMLGTAALVWTLPDRVVHRGLPHARLPGSGSFAGNFRQSLPLERFLDRTLPHWFPSHEGFLPNSAMRVLGAVSAAALVAFAVRLARAWKFRGLAAAVCVCVISLGGYLTLFTGLGKPQAVLAVLLVMFVTFATASLYRPRLALGVGLSVAIALLTHRSALAMLPAWGWTVTQLWRAHPGAKGRRGAVLLAAIPPLLVMLVIAPTLVRIVAGFDLGHHLAPASLRGRGLFAAAFDPLHLADLANILMIYVPALAVLPFALAGRPATDGRGRDRVLLWVLVVSCLPILLFIHPIQGVFRDLDVFLLPGVAVALLLAHATGSALAERRWPAWIATVLVATTMASSVQWLAHFNDSARGLRRAMAFATESPRRPDDELAQLWDLIGYRAFRTKDWPTAVRASVATVELAPHERTWLMLAIAYTYAKDHRSAQALYLKLSGMYPESPVVWLGVLGESLRLGDAPAAQRADSVLQTWPPGTRQERTIRRHLAEFPYVMPTREELGATPRASTSTR